MLSFKKFIKENKGDNIAPLHMHMNRKQMNALHKHKSYQSYIAEPMKQTYARPDTLDQGPGKHTRDFVVSTGGNYRMHVSMTHNGKILSHSIYRKGKPLNGSQTWDHVKTVDGK
jgi:hypothetical protein